jgi:hypothetical protein
MAGAFFFLRHVFLLTSREAKRLEAIAYSPVMVQVSETVQGMYRLVTDSWSVFTVGCWFRTLLTPPNLQLSFLPGLVEVRAFAAQDRFCQVFYHKLNDLTRRCFVFNASLCWLDFNMNMIWGVCVCVCVLRGCFV